MEAEAVEYDQQGWFLLRNDRNGNDGNYLSEVLEKEQERIGKGVRNINDCFRTRYLFDLWV